MKTYDLIEDASGAVLRSAVVLNMHTPDLPPGQSWREHVYVAQPKTADQVDLEYLRAHPKLAALKNMTPQQVQTYINNNFPSLTSPERDNLATLAIAVGMLARHL